MPMCSFEGCFSGSRKKDYRKPSNVHLHKFPKDPEMRRKWFDQIKLGSKVTKVNFETGIKNILFLKFLTYNLYNIWYFYIINSGVVCSNHFSTDSFAPKTFVQSTAGFSPITSRRLLPNAIPLRYFNILHYLS